MPNRPPHAPPAGRNDKEPGTSGEVPSAPAAKATDNAKVTGHDARLQNVKEQGDRANIQQNTTNKRFRR